MSPIRHLAFVVNESKSGAPALCDALEKLARAAGVATRRSPDFPVATDFLDRADACCAIGGDGTLLGVAPIAARAGVPLIGVNRGSLGFLTTFSADEARATFPAILAGAGSRAERTLLTCCTAPGQEDLALNDVLVKDERNSRLVRLEVTADGELVTEYHCDGLIFSTPTGSTAYNLSAGGPLVHPGAGVIAMTPICPHTLSNRSIIFREYVKLRIYNRGDAPRLLVAMDGQRNLHATAASPIEITISPLRLQLIQRPDHTHFHVLRTKLKWDGGAAHRP